MYEAGKGLLLRLLRVPDQPAMPEGSAQSLRVFRAAPAYFRYKLLGWALRSAWMVVVTIFALVGVTAAIREGDAGGMARTAFLVIEAIGIVGLVFSVVMTLLTLRLDYEMRWYLVTDRSLRIREGVFHVHEMTMTFANIQNITISQGPLQRFFGIADLRVQSAGGGGSLPAEGKGSQGHGRDLHVGWFRGVDDAPAIRDLVLQRLRRLRDAGLGDHDDARDAEARPAATDLEPSPDLVAALQELRAETARLREAAAARA